jgi:hypothetical protein
MYATKNEATADITNSSNYNVLLSIANTLPLISGCEKRPERKDRNSNCHILAPFSPCPLPTPEKASLFPRPENATNAIPC